MAISVALKMAILAEPEQWFSLTFSLDFIFGIPYFNRLFWVRAAAENFPVWGNCLFGIKGNTAACTKYEMYFIAAVSENERIKKIGKCETAVLH